MTEPRAHAVAAGQLALFAATAVALVTGTERRVLAAAAGVWSRPPPSLAGTGPWIIGAAVGVLLLVAYGAGDRRAGERFRPGPRDAVTALALRRGRRRAGGAVRVGGAGRRRPGCGCRRPRCRCSSASRWQNWCWCGTSAGSPATRAALTDRWQYPRPARPGSALATLGGARGPGRRRRRADRRSTPAGSPRRCC